jgi:DMSO/TMAO reductase YedYZ molybdopterin-dependent catalytic subunit
MRADLPPGQRRIDDFPRFGVPAFAARLPEPPPSPRLRLCGELSREIDVEPSQLAELPRRELLADFHCVTTWTSSSLRWSGWAFRDVYARFIEPELRPGAAPAFVELAALDGYRGCLLLEDCLGANVLLADRLNGEQLTREHGAPLRLVAPDLYGYKQVKHVHEVRLRSAYRRPFAERQTLAHPRGRVAQEERGRWLPGWVWRYVYRALLPPTLWYYRRVAARR